MIGSIQERKPKSAPVAPSVKNISTGFPRALHRSEKKKSAFLQSREANSRSLNDSNVPPTPVGIPSDDPTPNIESLNYDAPPDTLLAQISQENEQRVASMTEQERESERQEILARFGSGVGEILRKAREARERNPQGMRLLQLISLIN